ncbi:MAG TPA: hypothetical protein VMZ28_21325 [Kofleriaceae bacterium]|nr:hypothetical protein [Kofleriaceae bacterium]
MPRDVVEEHASLTKRYKSQICQRADGALQIHLLRRVEEDTGAAWAAVTTAASITDDIETARRIARQLLSDHDR